MVAEVAFADGGFFFFGFLVFVFFGVGSFDFDVGFLGFVVFVGVLRIGRLRSFGLLFFLVAHSISSLLALLLDVLGRPEIEDAFQPEGLEEGDVVVGRVGVVAGAEQAAGGETTTVMGGVAAHVPEVGDLLELEGRGGSEIGHGALLSARRRRGAKS